MILQKNNINSIILLALVLSWILLSLIPFLNIFTTTHSSFSQNTHSFFTTATPSPCHQAHSAQGTQTKSCQGFQISPYIISSHAMMLVSLFSGILFFLFFIDSLSQGFLNFPFKPPKTT